MLEVCGLTKEYHRRAVVDHVSFTIAPGLFLPLLEYIFFSSYPLGFLPWWQHDLAATPDKIVYIALSMTVLGLVTVFEWDAILPDRRDVAVLPPLPVEMSPASSAPTRPPRGVKHATPLSANLDATVCHWRPGREPARRRPSPSTTRRCM
ncbi:MAG: hypothetical protein ABSC08_07735, partial [Bryobacteraceae bacterium]|jgi:hypothetical protein